MNSSGGSHAVALMVGGEVSPASLDPAAAALKEFGLAPVAVASVGELENAAGDGALCGVIVASSDAALPAAAARAVAVPVVRVPAGSAARNGLALLQTDGGHLPAADRSEASFATVAIGEAGAKNAALFIVSLRALHDERVRAAWEGFRAAQTESVLRQPPPTLP